MPATVEAAVLTDGYRLVLLRLRDTVVRQLVRSWPLVRLDDLDATFAAWLALAVRALTAGQHEAAVLTDGYVAGFVAAETGDQPEPAGVEGTAGRTRDGRHIAVPLASALVGVMVGLARRDDQALNRGLARAIRVGRTEVMEAARSTAETLAVTRTDVRGLRRVTSGRACGACLALADGDVGARMRIHPSCRCTGEPVVVGVRETVLRPTGRELFERMTAAEQDALFAGRGGAAKAELVRTGAVPFEALVQRQSHPEWPDTITEAPLTALQPLP